MLNNTYEHTDLLWYARELGFEWNQALSILEEDNVLPEQDGYDIYYLDEETGELFGSGGLPFVKSESTQKILEGFMRSKNIDEITLI